MSQLSDAHELQLQSFLRFSHLKRQQHQQEILLCIKECEDNITAQEIDSAYHSSALLVKLQLLQAQQAGVAIAIDTAVLESEMLLQQIKACESAALSRPASDFVVKRGTLGGLSGGAGRAMLAASIPTQQQNQLKAEVDALRSRLESLQAVSSAAAADKADLMSKLQQAHQHLAARNAEAEQLRQQVAQALLDKAEATTATERAATSEAVAAVQASQAATNAAIQQLAAVQKQLKDKEAEAAALQQLLDGKLQDSKQWQQLRQLMQAKSLEVVTLRQQLAKYEPQTYLTDP
eukprot:gene5051-5292_t